jgi:Zn-dependent M28 family amino/carboxypeptidase
VTLHDYGTGINVVGVKPGFSKPQQRVLLSAHYDHLPGCPGADDNASGVAALLETARVLASARFDRSVVIACWDEGERGQLGSAAYAREALARGERIVGVFSYEAVGYTSSEPGSQKVPERFEEAFPDQSLRLIESDYRANFLTVIAETATEPAAAAVVRHGRSLGLPVHVLSLTERQKVKQHKLPRSDHNSFWDAGYPALLLTDTGKFRNPHFHCLTGPDRPDTLDYGFMATATRAGLGAAVELLQLR